MKLLSKKNNHKKQQRIKFITISALVSLAALAFIIFNFKNNIVFFYSPSELQNVKIKDGQIIRVGGLVKDGSIAQQANNLQFTITDLKDDLIIKYSGIKPDLFRAKQGMIAKGIWDQANNVFIASELLTKHDEKYMPPEIKKAVEKNAEYQKSHN
jgi:cytochrome c-type biogenesis protein CcmE